LPSANLKLAYYTNSGAAVADILFANSRTGFAYGPGLFATHDGGLTWKHQTLPPVAALVSGSGYVYVLTQVRYGRRVALWRAPLAGGAWTELRVPGSAQPARTAQDRGVQLNVVGSTVILLQQGFFGPPPTRSGRIFISSDGGTNWRALAAPCKSHDGGAALLATALGKENSWLIDCYSNMQSSEELSTRHRIYKSDDGGRSWSLLGIPTRRNGPILLASNGAGGDFLATEGLSDLLVGSLDGGRHWQQLLRSGGSFYGWADLRFVNRRTGFIVGPTHYAPEHIYRTDNGGRTWQILPI
jgi:photosystem II stability/assembly factor-like uncharacterized protein